MQRRYSRVVVLYSDSSGNGYVQINAIARIIGGSGAVAFAPNGDVLKIPSLGNSVPEVVKTLLCTSAARIVLMFMVDLPMVLKRLNTEVSE